MEVFDLRAFVYRNTDTIHSYLKHFKPEVWLRWRDPGGANALYYAIAREDVKSIIMLIRAGIDVENCIMNLRTAFEAACVFRKPYILKLLCVCVENIINSSKLLRFAIGTDMNCAKKLIANRIWIKEDKYIRTSDIVVMKLADYERQIRLCRSAAVCVLRLHKLGRINVGCKYAAREIAYAIWATRESWE